MKSSPLRLSRPLYAVRWPLLPSDPSLYAPVVNVTNGRGAFGKECRRRYRHRRIWDMVKIEIHRIQLTTASNHIIIAPLNLRAHLFQCIRKLNIPLDAVFTNKSLLPHRL